MSPHHEEEFKRVGGRLCLDFVNTVGGRTPEARESLQDYAVLREQLTSVDRLEVWARQSGLSTGGQESRSDEVGLLRRALELREALYRIFRSAIREEPAPRQDLDLLSTELRTARQEERLVSSSEGRFELRRTDKCHLVDLVLGAVAETALKVLTSAELERVRECPGEECGWIFLDDSRSRSRRWCDMKDCGNRAKVRRFRARQASNGG